MVTLMVREAVIVARTHSGVKQLSVPDETTDNNRQRKVCEIEREIYRLMHGQIKRESEIEGGRERKKEIVSE